MQNVMLLSELHPLTADKYNPLSQARDWFGLITQQDIVELQQRPRLKYGDAIAVIEQRASSCGKSLVLRDWAHLDYTGFPFRTPGYSPMLFTELADHFNIIRISISRDPVTQWHSLIRLPMMQNALKLEKFDLDQFLLGYRKYAELCVETGFIRYEDFVREPEKTMLELCDHLRLDFDSSFINNWFNYNTISGDLPGTRRGNEIKPVPMHPVEPELKERFIANADYHQAIELLGYDRIS